MKNNRFSILVMVSGAALLGFGLDTGMSSFLFSGAVCAAVGFFEWIGS